MTVPVESFASHVPHPGDVGGKTRTQKNLQIQWLRLSAGLAVLLFHASSLSTGYPDKSSFDHIFDGRFGLFGISLFFAISGYLMATAIKVQNPFLFLSHRVIRIYPLFLVVYALYYGAYHLAPHSALPHIGIQDLLLVPHGQIHGVLRVEWSLIYEVTFYSLIFVIGVMGYAAYLPVIAIAWLIAMAVGTLCHFADGSTLILLQQILLCPASVGLAAGLLVPTVAAMRFPPWLFGLLGIGLFLFFPDGESIDTGRWMYGTASALVLAGVIGFSKRRPDFGDTKLGRGAAKAADLTYALYLCHMPILLAFYNSHLNIPAHPAWGIAVATSILAAVILGSGEVAAYRYLKTAVNKARPSIVKSLALVFMVIFGGFTGKAAITQQAVLNRNHHAAKLAGVFSQAVTADKTRSIDGVMAAMGYNKAADLAGNVDGILWQEGLLSVWGWALDTKANPAGISVILFQGNRPIGGIGVSEIRHEVDRRYHVKRDTGFEFKTPAACDAAAPVQAVIATTDKRYAILPGQAQMCP